MKRVSKSILLKRFIKTYFEHFSYFYTYLRYRLIISIGLTLIVGLLDGFGLAMFLPLLEMVDGKKEATAEGLGNLSFILDAMEGSGLNLTIGSVLFVIMFFFILKGIAKFIETYYRVITLQYFIKKVRFDLIEKLSNYSYKSFVQSDSGRIQNTLTGEVERVSRAYQAYSMAIQAGIMVLVYIGLAFLTNPQFAVLVVTGGIASNLIYKRIYNKTKEVSRNITAYNHKFQGLLIQKVLFFKYFRSSGFARSYAKKLKESVQFIEENNKRVGIYNAILVATREPVVVAIVVIVILVQINFFSESLGLIILSLLFFYRSLTFLMTLQNYWNSFLTVSGSLENMTHFLKELSTSQDKDGTIIFSSLQEGIRIDSLSFCYGREYVLKNINLYIKKNETIAFVGESGSGKTTLVNLVAGLMPIEQGGIKIDGNPLSTLSKRSYQNRIGYITQEAIIFDDTIYNNVTLWAEDNEKNRQKFWYALKKAAIDTYVREAPEGENTVLGSNGVLISGGQKQRLSIARELYKDIDILIMDEATSALDSETEKVIQQNIYNLKGSYTILIIAHRLSTVKEADKVILLNKGEIVSIGSFESLMHTSKKFQKMVAVQDIQSD